MKRGISLITLIITIIVIIILARAIILNLNETDIISNTNKAVYANDVKTINVELNLFHAEQYMSRNGDYNKDLLKVDIDKSVYYDENNNDIEDIDEEIVSNLSLIFKSLGNDSKYLESGNDNEITIVNGELQAINSGSIIDQYIQAVSLDEVALNPLQINEIAKVTSIFGGIGKAGAAYNNPVVPKAFKAVNTSAASWDNIANDFDNGLVIEDEIGNQFVWIPVDGITVLYDKNLSYFGPDPTGDDETALPSGVIDETNQITNYGGFYIGRYEAGIDGDTSPAKSSTNDNPVKDGTISPVSKAGVSPWNYINYADSLVVSKSMYNTDSYGVRSGIPTGIMWDSVMSFVADAGYDVVDSRGFGNYIDSISPANDENGDLRVTGYKDVWSAKNIYDLAGNTWEWTNETYNSDRIRRGGDYNDSGNVHSASYRLNISTLGNGDVISFRIALFII